MQSSIDFRRHKMLQRTTTMGVDVAGTFGPGLDAEEDTLDFGLLIVIQKTETCTSGVCAGMGFKETTSGNGGASVNLYVKKCCWFNA